jgi:hypothetical protein
MNGGAVLAAGDVDGDGTLDLIGLSRTPPAVSIWTNLRDGKFRLHDTLTVNSPAYVLAVGAFNIDGLSDFALGFAGSSQDIDIYTNQGDGKFELTFQLTTPNGAFKLAVADLNGDGAPDLVIGDGTEQLDVALNRGDGSNADVIRYTSGFLTQELAIGDVDGDGPPDIVGVSAPFSVPSVGVFSNLRNGAFGPATTYTAICDATGPIALGDFNADGRLDVARTCWQGGNRIAVRLNEGDGTLGSETGYDVGPWPWAIAIGRFLTTDGPLDIAAAPTLGADYGGTGVSVFPGKGDGTFGKPLAANSPVSNTLVAGDFNGDGHPDIAFAAGDTLGVLYFVCE